MLERLPRTVVVVIVLLFIASVYTAVRQQIDSERTQDQLAAERAERAKLEDSVNESNGKLSTAVQQANSLIGQIQADGKKPVVEPTDVPEPVAPTAPTPSRQEIRTAVAFYCVSTGTCEGQRPTTSQVRTAVQTFCSGDTCRGRTGQEGADGTDGTDGAAGTPGSNGADATPEMVDAAVARYCAGGQCRGEDGTDGADGEDGTDATPFSFSFTIEGLAGIGDRTYTCTIQSPNSQAICS